VPRCIFTNILAALPAVALFLPCTPGHAASLQTNVPGTTMPWAYGAKLNHKKQFGNDDGTAPVVVSLSALGATAGQKLSITYISGTVCPGGSYSCGDAKGYLGFVTDHNTGNSGKYFPSRYIAKEPSYLDELIGVYTDATGKIVGRPFLVPDKAGAVVPAGATQLQLGVNDDIFSDNSGNWVIQVKTK
jgi:hypothetical protein